MLAFHHPHPQPQNYMSSAYNAFLPAIPSPLSPRSANVGHKSFRFSMASSHLDQENANISASEQKGGKQKAIPFAKRAVKKAPSPTQDELKERRRRNFLRKVEEGREGRRFEARGEDMQRLEFYRQQRAWEAEQSRAAPDLRWDVPDEEFEEFQDDVAELPASSWTGSAMQFSQPPRPSQPQDEVDEVMAREDEELAALLENMPEDSMQGTGFDGDGASELFGSDDEDYDALFSELIERERFGTEQQQGQQQQQQQFTTDVEGGEAMDMS